LLVSPVDLVKNWGGGWLILAGFIAAGCWKPGASFELAAPTHLSSCLDESWGVVNAHKELQNEGISGVFDQKLVILGLTFFIFQFLLNLQQYYC